MSASRPYSRPALQAIAVCLAGFYGLISAVGDGLHCVVHVDCVSHLAEQGDCGSAPVVCGSGHCCDGGCGFDQLSKLRRDDPRESQQIDATAAESAGGLGEAQEPHSHDCEVCKLLAQLKMASPVVDVSPATVCVARDSVIATEETLSAVTLLAFAARGPPALV